MQRSLKMLMLSLIFAAACENEIMRKRSTIIYPAANLRCDLLALQTFVAIYKLCMGY